MDQIIGKLRQTDWELGQGKDPVEEACRALEITVQTYYHWRQKYGGMQPAMAKQLKALQKENSHLKKVVADQVQYKDPSRGRVGKLVGPRRVAAVTEVRRHGQRASQAGLSSP